MRDVAPPSGQQPPPEANLQDGRAIELHGLAAAASDRHLADHPELIERYGPHTRAWCVHDLQWLLLWAIQDADGQGVDFAQQLDWLVRVLEARDYPLPSLADALDTLAAEVGALPGAGDRLRVGVAQVRG
jgi:hypothetical protein